MQLREEEGPKGGGAMMVMDRMRPRAGSSLMQHVEDPPPSMRCRDYNVLCVPDVAVIRWILINGLDLGVMGMRPDAVGFEDSGFLHFSI